MLGADAEPLLAAQAQQHIRLKRERGQLRALATTLVLLDQAQQAEDILEPWCQDTFAKVASNLSFT